MHHATAIFLPRSTYRIEAEASNDTEIKDKDLSIRHLHSSVHSVQSVVHQRPVIGGVTEETGEGKPTALPEARDGGATF